MSITKAARQFEIPVSQLHDAICRQQYIEKERSKKPANQNDIPNFKELKHVKDAPLETRKWEFDEIELKEYFKLSDSERINQAFGDLREGKTGIKRAATNMGIPGNVLFLFLTSPLQLNESPPMADSENPYLLNIVSNVVTGEINNWEHTYERVDNITRQTPFSSDWTK